MTTKAAQHTAHTPGPWQVELQLGLPVIVTEAGTVVAEALIEQGVGALRRVDGAQIRANIAANARLIAAAPDLLEALEAIVAYSHSLTGRTFNWNMWEEIERKAEAALAKARGK